MKLVLALAFVALAGGCATRTAGAPASRASSASAGVATVTPAAPAASCAAITSAHLCVLTCGQSSTPSPAACAAIRATLRSSTS